MLYSPKIFDYLKILNDDVKWRIYAIIFSEYSESTRTKLRTNLRKVAKSLYIFLATTHEIKKYVEIMQSNSSDKNVHR